VFQCVVVCCSHLSVFIETHACANVAICCRCDKLIGRPAVLLQCVAVRCSVLQCVAVCCIVFHCVAVCCSVLQCVAVFCSAQSVEMRETLALDSDAQATLLPYEVRLYLYSTSKCNPPKSAATLPENLSASVAVNIKKLLVLFALTHISVSTYLVPRFLI